MPRTSTAEANDYVCPLCGENLAQDHEGAGFVHHLARPRGATIFDDQAKVERMLAAGDLAADYRTYFDTTGHCPFQQGQRDEQSS